MNVTRLSCQYSPVENARRMAENNAQSTEACVAIQKEMIDCPAEQVRVRCIAAIVGLVGLGILIACTTSVLVGGTVLLAATIPAGISHSYAAKMEKLHARFINEGNNDLKFICTQITVLFAQATQKKCQDLVIRWNDGQSFNLNIENERKLDKAIYKKFKEMVEQYDESEFYTLTFENQQIKVPYKDLKRYAFSIAQILPKEEKDTLKRMFYGNHWAQELQGVCQFFNDKYRPEMEIEDFQLDEFKNQLPTARKFFYDSKTDYDSDDSNDNIDNNQKIKQIKKVKVCLLKSCAPEE